jgi:hypothetical protein
MWAKLDDTTWRDPKMTALRDAAFRLYLCMTAYAADNLTDGVLEQRQVEQVAAVNRLHKWPALAEQLVALELLESNADCWTIVGYTDRNPSREDYETRRSRDKKRLKDWRAGRQLRVVDGA